jgi:predicted dehydrogenase
VLGIAIVGAGHWGPNLIRNFHNRQTSRVAWVIDPDHARRERVTASYGSEIQVGADFGQACDDVSVDAVVVATPTTTHYGLVKTALEHGKHVLVEKPITTNGAEAEELCAIADENKLVLMVGHVFLYSTAVRRVRQILEAGELGRVYYLSMVRTNLGPIRMDVNAAWDLAAHDVSIANYWLDAEPVSVSALGGVWINPGFEDAVFATLRYLDNILVTLHVSWLNPRKAREVTVVGDQRMLTYDDMNLSEPLRVYDRGVCEQPPAPAAGSDAFASDTFASFRASIRQGDITIPNVSLNEPLKAESDHFLDCVAFGRSPMTTGWDGLATVRTLEALQRSIANHGLEESVT